MANKTIVVDDFDEQTPATTVTFSVDGVTYDIDLSEENHEKMRAAFAPYVERARRRRGGRTTAVKARTGDPRKTTAKTTAKKAAKKAATPSAAASASSSTATTNTADPAPVAGTNDTNGESAADVSSEPAVTAKKGSRKTNATKSVPSRAAKSTKKPSAAAKKSSAYRNAASGRGGKGRKVDVSKVREWAQASGIEVASRGRVPAGVVEQYLAAQPA